MNTPTTPQDGGPAFPVPATHNPDGTVWYHAQEGMSLRDWLSGQALAGLMANPETARSLTRRSGSEARDDIADVAVKMADATISRLRKEGA